MPVTEPLRISLAAARVNANMNQKEFAKALGVSEATIVSWEKGTTGPTAKQFKEISKLTKIPMDFIFLPT